MVGHRLDEIWASEGVAIGASCKVPSSLTAEVLASSGVEFVYVDGQHGVIDDVALVTMIQAIAGAGASPLVRVSANRADLIGHALDFGAAGVIVPLVETADAAAEAAAACRYPPEGVRSRGSVRGQAATPTCVVLVETSRGVDNVAAIAATPGVDVVMVGTQDLALSLGVAIEGDWLRRPEMTKAIGEILATCVGAGVVAGIGAGNGAEAARWVHDGFRMVTVGNDMSHLRAAIGEQVRAARAGLV